MDAFVSPLYVTGNDRHKSANKLGIGLRGVNELTHQQLFEYIAPFVRTAAYHKILGILLHDGLDPQFIKTHTSEYLKFELAPVYARDQRHNNVERRFFAIRDWLYDRSQIKRIWINDVNDVTFVRHPWKWMDDFPDRICIGTEWHPYTNNAWFQHQFDKLPPRFIRRFLADDVYPYTCGSFGGPRVEITGLLVEMCEHMNMMADHLGEKFGDIVLDMVALGYAAMSRSRIVSFQMDGKTVTDRVKSPLIHDRKSALEWLDANESLSPPTAG